MPIPVVTPPPPRALRLMGPDGNLVQVWSGWFRNLYNVLVQGLSTTQNNGITTIVLAKLTPGGTNGALTVSNGLITSYTAPT